MDERTKKQIEEFSRKKFELWARIKKENRDPTPEEDKVMSELNGAISAYMQQPGERETVLRDGPLGGGSGISGGSNKPFALRKPTDPKDYRSMFGSVGYSWPDKDISFLQAVFSGRAHPELIKAATMTEGIPSDGGFLVPTEYASKIHNVALEDELVMPRAYVQPMISNECKIPAMEIGSHGAALMGGFTASYTAELGTISEANPKSRGMTLNAKKLTGLIRFSNELVADIPGGENQIVTLCGKGLGWYRDKAFLKGTGTGEPLGILNAPCLVTVAKELGQEDAIMYENLTQMMSRMFSGSFKNSVWVCHQSTIPSLLQLSIAIGTGGDHIPVMSESNGEFRMLTRPVVFTEKTEPLGTKGDLMLCDFSQYCVGLRQGMRFDYSAHVGFTTDELLARLVERHDGQPLWDEALTLADGATTVSPFVCLAAR